ncbi:MAG: ImmA/IrrE family metallo-endopeptidase [Ruminococcaceae bacterium]|nr:ImmA/IrrE family metallo-endopeptidase [Oscillospiraceae bacterium]
MTEARKKLIEDKALSLLLSQRISGEYALSFLDLRRITTCGAAVIDTFSSYEKKTCSSLPTSAEGITLKLPGMNLILYDDKITNAGRRNWTIAHELGHVLLSHASLTKETEREADAFAAELLMPEAVIRYLDQREGEPITPDVMTSYFSASLTACKRRRLNLPYEQTYQMSEDGLELLKRLFAPNE